MHRVYVVDQDRGLRRALRFVLESWGYIVRTFADGWEFIEAVENGPEPDCLILGMRTAGIDGPTTLRELTDRGRKIPAIMMTTQSVGELNRQFGVVEVLPKPCGQDELLRSVERAIRSRRGPCPQCKGTGQYIGLNVIEECDHCGGSGWAPE